MLKRIVCTLLVFIIISVFGMVAYAFPTVEPSGTPAATPQATPSSTPKAEAGKTAALSIEDILLGVTVETDQFLVTITRPEYDTDSTYESSYLITGVSDDSSATVVLQVYDEESESYVPMENTDGESSWVIGSFGMFSKELKLKEGANKIRILAYSASQKAFKVEDVQVNQFTVYRLKSGIKELFRGVVDFTTNILEKIK